MSNRHVEYYSIRDIMEMLLPVKIGGFYETTQKFQGEYWTFRVKALGLRDHKTVVVQKIKFKTDINKNPREEYYVGSRRQLLMNIPLDIFIKHFTHAD